MPKLHPHNRRTLLLWTVALALAVAFVFLVAVADDAAAHSRRRGFEPTDATLACINRAEGSPAYDHDGRTYDGYGEMNRQFALAYSAAIGPEHWALWGSDRNAPTWTWHPMIQRETMRNGIRARGLQPWPPAHHCR